MSKSSLAFLAASALTVGFGYYKQHANASTPPQADEKVTEFKIRDTEFKDPYFWLRDDARKAPEIISHLEKENKYADYMMRGTATFQKALYNEFLSHLKEDDQDVPYKDGEFEYYKTTIKGKNYNVYWRRKYQDMPEGKENPNPAEIVLDVNKLAEDNKYDFCSVTTPKPSPDAKFIAFAVDSTGYEEYEIRVMDYATKKIIDTVPKTASFVWGDNSTLFYSTLDAAHRPYRLYKHVIGTKQDTLLHEEKDDKYWLSIGKSTSGRFVVLNLGSKMTAENWYIDLSLPADQQKLVLFAPRVHDVIYSIDHAGDHFWIVTNEEAKNFKLMRTPIANIEKKAWETILAHDPARMIDTTECFRNHVVVFGRKGGFSHVEILSLKDEKDEKKPFNPYTLQFPESIFTCEPSVNREWDSPYVRVRYTSLITPNSIYDVHLNAPVVAANATVPNRMILRKLTEVPKYDASLYKSELIHAKSHDGIDIPMSMVYRKDKYSGKNEKVLLIGYGSYGICYDPEFDYKRLSLLDRGVVVVYAHIRGGGEMGRLWYLDGKLMKKQNTFKDFICCAEHLVKTGFTVPQSLAISGGSAGGLLMGAVLNARPDLFKCCMTRVPFVDVMATMNDPTIPLTCVEYEEWGNPADPGFHEYMLSYSPYDNVKTQNYPAMLVTTALNDSRVAYWEPAKWVQKLRKMKTDNNLILLKCTMAGGHGGSSGRYSFLEEQAFNFAFILTQLGLDK